MAITNAQQYQQLVNKPANGKRPGYRGEGEYQGGSGAPGSAESSGGNTGGGTTGGDGGDGGNQNQFEINRKAKLQQEAKKLADERAARNRENKRIATVKENKRLREAKAKKDKEKRDREEKARIEKARIAKEQKRKQQLQLTGLDNTSKFGTTTKPGTRSSKKTGIATATTKNKFLTDEYLDNREQYGVLGVLDPKITDVDFDTGLEKQRLKNIDLSDELKDYKPEMKFPSLLSVFNLGTPKNIDYFRENNIGGVINPVTGQPYGYGIDGFKDYMRNVSLGTVNTGGRQLSDKEIRNKVGGGDDGNNNIIPISPTTTSSLTPVEETVDNRSELEKLLDARGAAYRFFADGGRVPAMAGGIMNPDIIGGAADGNIDDMGRQMYFIGKLVKKASKAVKKIVKSPVGKAALIGAGFGLAGMGPFKALGSTKFGLGTKNFFLNKVLGNPVGDFGTTRTGGLLNFIKSNPGLTIAGLSLSPFFFPGKEEEEEPQYEGPSIDIPGIRRDPYKAMGEAYRFAADGGLMRTAYAEGSKEPVAKKTMPLLDMDGKEMDLRDEGGFVPLGRMERADDVPARLSKNEFVFTADAVRNAGEGDIDKGAEVMYNMMKNLESGGEVSEESQGLDGAREMFKTSQRLEEVL